MKRTRHRKKTAAIDVTKELRFELRLTMFDVTELLKLRCYLGMAARLDLMPRKYSRSEAVRTAVRTMVLEFERNGFPDNPRHGSALEESAADRPTTNGDIRKRSRDQASTSTRSAAKGGGS